MAKSGTAEKRRVNVGAVEFVKVWLAQSRKEGGNYTAVAEELDMKATSCYQRYQKLNAKLRAEGRPTLPALPETAAGRGRRQLDLGALAALIGAPIHSETGESESQQGDVQSAVIGALLD